MTRILAVTLIATTAASWLLLRRAEKRRKRDVKHRHYSDPYTGYWCGNCGQTDPDKCCQSDPEGWWQAFHDRIYKLEPYDCSAGLGYTTSYDPHLYPLRPTMLGLGA